MIENDQHIQNWQPENKAALLAFIQENMTPCNYEDICVVGSRLYADDFAQSDIDIIVYRPSGEAFSANSFHEYDGVPVAILYRHISLRNDLAHGGYYVDPEGNIVRIGYDLPWYSLMTDTHHPGNSDDIAAWLIVKNGE